MGKNIKFLSLVSFFSVLTVRTQFSFLDQTKKIFLNEKLKKSGRELYNSNFFWRNISFWRKKNASWKVGFFSRNRKRRHFCCFNRKKIFITDSFVVLIFNQLIFSPFFNIESRLFQIFSLLDGFLHNKSLWLKIPISTQKIFGSFLNSWQNSFFSPESSGRLEEESERTNFKILKRVFLQKDPEISLLNWFEASFSEKTFSENFTFFSKIFQFLSSNYKKMGKFSVHKPKVNFF